MRSSRIRTKWNNGKWSQARFKGFIVGGLRSAFRRWPAKYEVLKNASVGIQVNAKTGRKAMHYTCVKCKKVHPRTGVQVDHKKPAVSTSGFTTWDEFIDRLFCEKVGLQVLCKKCHTTKTSAERKERK